MTAKKSINLEKSLADLEALVEELESGDLPLDKAMKKLSAGGEETLEEFDAND
jgi:exodeoxyribonuclease VII small subunit